MLLVALAGYARADELPPPIHWAFGPYFGTGYYELDEGEETYVLSARFGWQIRPAALDAAGRRSIGVRVRIPVALGAYSLDMSDIASTVNFRNVSTLSAVPGVEFDIPIGPRWSLKPVGYAGWGTRMDGDGSAWIYWLGLRSRVELVTGETPVTLVNALTYVGYRANDGDAGDTAEVLTTPSAANAANAVETGNSLPLLTAIEIKRPLGNRKLRGKQVHLYWHAGYTSYLNEPEFFGVSPATPALELDEEWELGVAFGAGDEPLRLWKLSWDRVGLGYRFDSDGEFRGITLVFSGMFDR